MNEERLMKVLLASKITEKSSMGAGSKRLYIFKVIKDATKQEIKAAVQLLFKTEVYGVRVCNVKPKAKRLGQRIGFRKAWKKAYVTLKDGQEINLASSEA